MRLALKPPEMESEVTLIVVRDFLNYNTAHEEISRGSNESTACSCFPLFVFCSPYWPFLPPQFRKTCEFFMYGIDLYSTILEQSISNNMVSKFQLARVYFDIYLHLCHIYSHLSTLDLNGIGEH